MRHPFIFFLTSVLTHVVLMLMLAGVAQADTFFVATDGVDSPMRDGRSKKSAWQSLAYACEQVPAGKHAISLAPGQYVAKRTAFPKSGVTIVGRKPWGKDITRIVASSDWQLCDQPHQENPEDEYLISFKKAGDIHIHSLALESSPDHRITGAIRCSASKNIHLHDLVIKEFRWNGLLLANSQQVNLHDCQITNASTDKSRYWGGSIRTQWLKHSEIHKNRIVSQVGGGYGYKGGGHEGVRIHHNVFDIEGGFAIESAHENEYGVEIDHNFANHCISIPKGGQGADPNSRGYEYSFWIHHNYLTHSYTIEGPRNHLRFDHNYVHVDRPNGRIYTHHGGKNQGPIWIHHNVIENVDRGFVWMNEGLAENIFVYNNTVICADAGDRTGSLFGAYTAERLNNWVVKNNLFIGAWSRPRPLMASQREVPSKIVLQNNLCLDITGAPSGNHVNRDPGLRREGEKPAEFFAPASGESFVVDKGVDVGLPFQGDAPEIGAIELGETWSLEDVPMPRK